MCIRDRIVIGFVVASAAFIVDQREQVLVLQLGEPRRVIQVPGLNFKIPLIENVVRYEKRVLNVDPPVEQLILADQRRLDVDVFGRDRIADPRLVLQAVNKKEVANQPLST